MTDEQVLDRRARRTRQALKSALVSLILDKGFDSVTIMDIAARADYNRGTFYKHFVSKEDLLKEIHDEFLQGIAELLVEPYVGLEQIEASMTYPSGLRLFEHIEQHKDVFLALSRVERGKLAMDMYDRLRESMRKDMHIEMEPTDPPVDYEIMLSYRMSATVGVIMHWAEVNFKYTASYMAQQLMVLVEAKMDYIVFKRNGST